MSKCYLHAIFDKNQVIISGDTTCIISLFGLNLACVFLSAVTSKIRSRSQSPNQFSITCINKCYIHADFSPNLPSCSVDIENNITFWFKFSVFLSAVTLKIRSRSQS